MMFAGHNSRLFPLFHAPIAPTIAPAIALAIALIVWPAHAQPARHAADDSTVLLFSPYGESADSLSGDPHALNAFMQALASEEAGDYEQAILLYQEVLAASPEDPTLLVRLASAYLEARDYPAALSTSERAIAADTASAEALWVKGASLAAEARYSEAADALTRSTEIRSDIRALQTLLDVLEHLGREGDMLVPLGRLIDQAHTAPRLLERRARILTSLDRIPQALEDYRRILEDSPTFPGVHDRVEALLPGEENLETRLDFYRQLVAVRPEIPDFRWKLIKDLMDSEQWSEAETELNWLREHEPGSPLAPLQLGLIEYRRGQVAEAFGLLDEAARIRPDAAIVDRWKMRLHFAEENCDSALAAADRLIAKAERAPDAWKTRALCLLGLNRSDEALPALRRWMENESEDMQPPFLAAGVLRSQDKLDEAIAMMREAIRRSPDRPELRIELAVYLQAAGRKDEGEQSVRDYLAEHPDDAVALNGLGYLIVERGGDLAEAERLIERALALQPDNPAFLDSKGWLWYKRGELSKAEKWLQKAIGSGGVHSEIFLHLAQVQSERKEYDRVLQTLERGLELNPGDAMLDSLRRSVPSKLGRP